MAEDALVLSPTLPAWAQATHTSRRMCTWGPRRDKVVVDGVDARRLAARGHLRVAQAARDARLACRPTDSNSHVSRWPVLHAGVKYKR